jgi:TolB-like protein/Tfp pilus assembly protein PilF
MEKNPSFSQPVRFGLFEVDLRAGELRKQGVRIKLQEQPLQILAMLLEHPGQVVTREELRSRLWPADTFVDFDHGLNKSINKLREALGDSAENPRFIETLAKRGYRFIRDLQGSPGQIRSLLVLPLENLSGDPEQEYFADGLTEELITKLARISALRVLSRTTAMHYKGVRKPLPEIARELQVEGVVEGTVLRSGDRVRISAQLIHAPTDTHLWAESYERELRDVLALQSEIAQAIAREVQVKVTPEEQAHISQVRPVEPAAYEAYLKGRYYWNQRSGGGLSKGAECFQQAIEKDPGYAMAWAGLADCASSAGWLGFLSPAEGCGKGKRLALRALELDPGLAEAHCSLGWATVHYDYDFLTAEREYQRSIELNPSYATAHQWYGLLLSAVGRFEQACNEVEHAIHLDPPSAIITASLGWVYWISRQYERQFEQLNKTLELDPNFIAAYWGLGLVHLAHSKFEEAIAKMQKAVEVSRGSSLPIGLLGEAYAAAGCKDQAQKVLDQLMEISKHKYVTPYIIARIYSALDNKDEAFQWLERAYLEHSVWMVFLRVDPRLDSLRSDARFDDLLRRMNFPAQVSA